MTKKLSLNILRWIFRAWRYRLVIEKHEIKFMLDYLAPGNIAVDIGAHKGAYTYWMSKYVGEKGKVFSFEPQPRLNKQLRLLLNDSKNIKLEDLALSSNKVEDYMVIPNGETSPSASISNTKHEINSIKILVEKTTLDDYFYIKKQIPINFIKCDVEGHELDVLKGGQQVLRKFKPIISLESEARHCGEDNVINVFKFLDDLGYAGYFFNGESMLSLDCFDIQKYQLNRDKKNYVNYIFFIPKNN